MSRCFSYPPPGYEVREIPDLDQLMGEMEKTKERKQKEINKRERREKKEQSRGYGKLKLQEKKHSMEDRGKDERRQANQVGADHKKRKLEEVEWVEKSNITEEQGQPARTQSSVKRKKHNIDAGAAHNQGKARHGGLMDNWQPPELRIENADFDYENWLFKSKQLCKQGAKNYLVGDNLIPRSSCLQPWACYLPAAEIYSLPYIIPY